MRRTVLTSALVFLGLLATGRAQDPQPPQMTAESTSDRPVNESRPLKALTYLSLFGLAITIPLLLLLGALLFQSVSAQRAQLQDRVSQVRDALVGDVDRDLDRDITILRTLATSQALATADWRTFYDQAEAGLQGRAYLVLVDARGRQLVNTYVPYGQQPAMTGDPETVRRVVQTKAPVVSDLFVSLVVKKPVFNVSIPILQNGDVRYVMSLGLLPEDLVALLASQQLAPQWVTMIWDSKGVILARSRDNARYVGTPLPDSMREHDRPDVVRRSNLDGIDVLDASARSRVAGWGVGVNVPYSLIAEPLRNSLLLWAAATVLAITIALALGLFLAGQITTSLSVAATAAAAFGRGESFALTGSRIKEADAFLATLRRAQQARDTLTEEVKQNRDWLHTVLASIGDGVIATDGDGRITFLNGVSQRLTGWAQEEAIGRRIEEVFVVTDEETGAAAENPAMRAMRDGMIVGLANHAVLVARDGTKTPIDDSGCPIKGADGRTVGAVLIFRDVTERRRAEREIERANRLKDDFLAVLSHELRTPLNAVLGYSHLLSAGALSPERTAHALDAIQRNALAQTRLVESLLDLSRIMAGKLELDHADIDLTNVLDAAIDVIRPDAEAKEIRLDVEMPRRASIAGDSSRLQQVFWNLLANAVKFTPRGGCIRIHVVEEEAQVRIDVSDTGVGISAEFLPHVFDRFKQADNHKRRSPGGLGLGLALVREMVQAHGGSVVAYSNGDGHGSTFTVRLPVAAAHQRQPAAELSTDAVESLGQIEILVVDDEADVRDLMALLLESRGAKVRVAASAREALDAVRERRPDMLLADLGMPDDDGLWLIETLRAEEREQQATRLAAIAVTAYASARDRERAIAAGYDGHVAKPVDPTELARAIIRVVNA